MRVAASLVLALAGVIAAAPLAGAAEGCPPGQVQTPVAGGGVVCIKVEEPGKPPTPGPEEPPTEGSSGCYRDNGEQVDCVNDWGVWVYAHQCWAHPVNIPPGAPEWKGHTDGAVWMCALIDDTSPEILFWVPDGVPSGGPPDPGALATTVLDTLPLAKAEVHLAPAYPNASVVGVETWLWLPAWQWQVLTKPVTAGSTTVTVTAAPEQVVWQMGPATKTCFSAGRPWVDGLGDDAVTDCGYIYRETSAGEPDGAFAVTATIRYDVTWTCTGACTQASGSLGLVDAPAGSGQVRVTQRQTVVVR